jgi:hypothetical protein
MNRKKYLLWFAGVIVWNFGVPNAKPIMDIIAALFLRHVIDLDRLFTS